LGATASDIERLGLKRGHRTLIVTRHGRQGRHRPVRARTALAIDLAARLAAAPALMRSGDRVLPARPSMA
jgi:hypothetical protein